VKGLGFFPGHGVVRCGTVRCGAWSRGYERELSVRCGAEQREAYSILRIAFTVRTRGEFDNISE